MFNIFILKRPDFTPLIPVWSLYVDTTGPLYQRYNREGGRGGKKLANSQIKQLAQIYANHGGEIN